MGRADNDKGSFSGHGETNSISASLALSHAQAVNSLRVYHTRLRLLIPL